MPSSAPTVITPLPPMPVTSTLKGRRASRARGLGQRREERVVAAVGAFAAAPCAARPPITETKLGQ